MTGVVSVLRFRENAALGRQPKGKLVRLRRWLTVILLPLAALGLWTAHLFHSDNFHPIVAGQAYRSGQMSSNELVRCIRQHGIRSIINLRGEHPELAWYREEMEAAASQHVVHRSIALSARKSVTVEQANELAALFKAVPKPVLIHCDGGADRTAFAAALYAAEIAREPRHTAEREFSVWYGYLPFIWKEKAQLRESFRAHTRRNS